MIQYNQKSIKRYLILVPATILSYVLVFAGLWGVLTLLTPSDGFDVLLFLGGFLVILFATPLMSYLAIRFLAKYLKYNQANKVALLGTFIPYVLTGSIYLFGVVVLNVAMSDNPIVNLLFLTGLLTAITTACYWIIFRIVDRPIHRKRQNLEAIFLVVFVIFIQTMIAQTVVTMMSSEYRGRSRADQSEANSGSRGKVPFDILVPEDNPRVTYSTPVFYAVGPFVQYEVQVEDVTKLDVALYPESEAHTYLNNLDQCKRVASTTKETYCRAVTTPGGQAVYINMVVGSPAAFGFVQDGTLVAVQVLSLGAGDGVVSISDFADNLMVFPEDEVIVHEE